MVNTEIVKTLFYDPEINRFRDELGDVVHDIHRLITHNQILLFRKYRNIYIIPDVTNSFLVELIYYDELDDLFLGYGNFEIKNWKEFL